MQALISGAVEAIVCSPDRAGRIPGRLIAALPDDVGVTARQAALVLLRLANGSSHRVGLRPDRFEPRAIKRRKSTHKLLTKPRAEARADLLNA